MNLTGAAAFYPSFSPVLLLQLPEQAVLALECLAGLCAFIG